MDQSGRMWCRPRPNRVVGWRLLGLLTSLGLGGCSWFGAGGDAEAPPAVCPAALLLSGAERMIAYEPGRERSESAIRYTAAIDALETDCRRTATGLEIDLRFTVVAEAGAALAGEPVTLDLFVASVRNGRMVGRERLRVPLEIGQASARVGRLENVTVGLPEPVGDERLYVGFELDQETARERLDRSRRRGLPGG